MPERSAKMACVLEAPLRMSVLSVSAAGRALPDLGPRRAPLSGDAGSGPGVAPGAGAVRAAGPRSFPLAPAPQLLPALVFPLRGSRRARSAAAEAPELWMCGSPLARLGLTGPGQPCPARGGPGAAGAALPRGLRSRAGAPRCARVRPGSGLCRCRNRGSLPAVSWLLRQGGAAVLREL